MTKLENVPLTPKKRLVQGLKDCFDGSTSHGLPRIHQNFIKGRYFFAVFWAVAFLGSTSYCLYTIIVCFQAYYSYNVKLQIQRLNDLPAIFPAITICNQNPYYERSNKVLKVLSGLLNGVNCFTNSTNGDQFQKCFKLANPGVDSLSDQFDFFIDRLNRIVAANTNLTSDMKSSIGYDLSNDMLVSCQYNSGNCTGIIDNMIASEYRDNYRGNCFTFNIQKPFLRTSATSERSGLHLELTVRSPKKQTMLGYYSGVYVVVHNQSALPFTLPDGINIPTGYTTYIGINRNFINKLSSPYSNCLNELQAQNDYAKVLFGYFSDLNVTYYDQNLCYTLCFQDQLIDQCACSDISTPPIRNSMYCVNLTQIDCLYEFDSFFTSTDIDLLCKSACPEKCHTIEYDLMTNSMATFPTLTYLKNQQAGNWSSYMFPNGTDADLIEFGRTGFLKLIINYDNLYYTSIVEHPSTSSNVLFGYLGGQLGLFIGISALSFLEIIDFIISFFAFYCSLKKKNLEENKKSRESA